jgi:hypothetical protein
MANDKQPELVATITDDLQLAYSVPRLLTYHLGTIGKGQTVTVAIKKYRKPSTNKQRAYLWAAVYPAIVAYILSTTGQKFTTEDLHTRYKKKYLGYDTCDLPGMTDLMRVRSSTETDTQEFWENMIEPICQEWAELGLYIPLPEKKIDVHV